MRFRCLRPDLSCRALCLALLAWFACGRAPAQNVVLHLRNGDRIAGVILSENTNQLMLSNVWSRALVVPLSQIERREITPPSALAATGTNLPAKKSGTLPPTVKIASIPAITNSWWRRWKGEAAIGTDLERGTVDNSLYYGRAKLTYAQPYKTDPKQFFRNIITYDVEYGKTDGVTSDNRMNGSFKTDFDLSRRYYVYNLGSAGYDHAREIDLRYEEGPGAGYHWFTQTNFTVNMELGANYQVEDRSDDTRVASVYYRMGQNLSWKINKQMSLSEKYEYLPRAAYSSQYRMRFESTLSYALVLNLLLNVSVIDFYDTQPALTVPNNDVEVRTSLGIKF